MFGGIAAFEHIGHAEAESIQCFGGFFIDRCLGVDPPPTVLGQVHPFTAGFEEEFNLFRAQVGVFDFEPDREIEPILLRVGRGIELHFNVSAQGLVQQTRDFGREFGVDVR